MPVNLWLPRSFTLFGTHVPIYNVFLYLGFVLFLLVFFKECARAHIERKKAIVLGLIISICGFWFAWLLMYIIKGKTGLSLYGAAIGSVIAGGIYARWQRIPLLKIGDAAAPATVLAFGVMKIGCLISGCCYGVPTVGKIYAIYHMSAVGVPPKVILHHPSWENIPLVPVQLWISLLCFGIFALSYPILPWTNRKDGRRLGVILCMYAAGRFVIDFFGSDLYQFGPLIANQWFGIAMIVASIILILYKPKSSER